MSARLPILAAAILLAAPPLLRAGDMAATDSPAAVADDSSPESKIKTSYEIDADSAFVGAARSNFGGGVTGGVSELENDAKLVVAPQYEDGPIYRFGLAYQEYNFGLSKAAPLPNILQAENVVVGMDFELFDSWLVRVEADPGFYGDGRDNGTRDFNVPFEIGGSYISSDMLQWIVGLEVDVNRQIPIFPAIGLRWQVTDELVVDAVLPTPRLEYDWSKNLTLYVGANVDDGTYRVDQGLGTSYDNAHSTTTTTAVPGTSRIIGFRIVKPFPPQPIIQISPGHTSTTVSPSAVGAKLGGTIVEYDEVRIGAGFSWKATKAITLEMECGYLPYREFDFHRADVHFSNDDGAAYGSMSLNAQF
jgi:hypothetical protein